MIFFFSLSCTGELSLPLPLTCTAALMWKIEGVTIMASYMFGHNVGIWASDSEHSYLKSMPLFWLNVCLCVKQKSLIKKVQPTPSTPNT